MNVGRWWVPEFIACLLARLSGNALGIADSRADLGPLGITEWAHVLNPRNYSAVAEVVSYEGLVLRALQKSQNHVYVVIEIS